MQHAVTVYLEHILETFIHMLGFQYFVRQKTIKGFYLDIHN